MLVVIQLHAYPLLMGTVGFFEERSDQSEVKARIIQKYFFVWASVITHTERRFDKRIGYIDLYAGPGRYRARSCTPPPSVKPG